MKNTIKLTTITLLISLCFSVFIACGCANKASVGQSTGKSLKIGYIDTDILMMASPELVKFMEKKMKKRQEIERIIFSKQLSESEKKQLKKTTDDFIAAEKEVRDKFVKAVEESCSKVAKEKNIYFILNNKSSEPIIEYGGIDITEEVKKIMK